MTLYIIAPSAGQDLNKIADYFLVVNIEAGEKLFRKFYKKCQQLVQFPKLGRSYSHIKPSLRGLPLDGYIIFYRVINETVLFNSCWLPLTQFNFQFLNQGIHISVLKANIIRITWV
jgi:toxin ParE1/3/4